MARLFCNVDTHGLGAKLEAFSAVEAKKAIRSGVQAAGRRGKSLARAGAPVRTGRGRNAIRNSSRSLGDVAVARVFITGGSRGTAYYMFFQDQGTGPRHTRSGAYRGVVTPTLFMERAAI